MPSFLRRRKRMNLWAFSIRYWSKRKANRQGKSRNKSSILSGERMAASWWWVMTNLINSSTRVLRVIKTQALLNNRHHLILLCPHRGLRAKALKTHLRVTTSLIRTSRRAVLLTISLRISTIRIFTTSRVVFWAIWMMITSMNKRWIIKIWPFSKWTP